MERNLMATANHPFTCTLYHTFQTNTKMYFITQYCAGGELFKLQRKQPGRRFNEDVVRFYAAEILLVSFNLGSREHRRQVNALSKVVYVWYVIVGTRVCSLHGLSLPRFETRKYSRACYGPLDADRL